MKLSMKKSFSMMMLVFMLVLAFAVPASAASQSYEFYYQNNPSSSYNAHVNSYIVGDADVTGTTVTITLQDDYYPQLQADNGTGTFVTYYPTYDANGNTVFTFTNSNPTADINTVLSVAAGPHSSDYALTIHWN